MFSLFKVTLGFFLVTMTNLVSARMLAGNLPAKGAAAAEPTVVKHLVGDLTRALLDKERLLYQVAYLMATKESQPAVQQKKREVDVQQVKIERCKDNIQRSMAGADAIIKSVEQICTISIDDFQATRSVICSEAAGEEACRVRMTRQINFAKFSFRKYAPLKYKNSIWGPSFGRTERNSMEDKLSRKELNLGELLQEQEELNHAMTHFRETNKNPYSWYLKIALDVLEYELEQRARSASLQEFHQLLGEKKKWQKEGNVGKVAEAQRKIDEFKPRFLLLHADTDHADSEESSDEVAAMTNVLGHAETVFGMESAEFEQYIYTCLNYWQESKPEKRMQMRLVTENNNARQRYEDGLKGL